MRYVQSGKEEERSDPRKEQIALANSASRFRLELTEIVLVWSAKTQALIPLTKTSIELPESEKS